MSTIIGYITDLINAIFVGDPTASTPVPSWISTIISTITSNPLILIAVLVPFVGLGIGLLRRLIGTRA